jgi:hypothetical protein
MGGSTSLKTDPWGPNVQSSIIEHKKVSMLEIVLKQMFLGLQKQIYPIGTALRSRLVSDMGAIISWLLLGGEYSKPLQMMLLLIQRRHLGRCSSHFIFRRLVRVSEERKFEEKDRSEQCKLNCMENRTCSCGIQS